MISLAKARKAVVRLASFVLKLVCQGLTTQMHDAKTSSNPKKSFYERWSNWILLCVIVFAPAAFFGASKAIQSNVNKIEDWLPKSFAETEELVWFRKNFPTDQFILISWEGCEIGNDADIPDDPRIGQLTRLLRGESVPELDANLPAYARSLPAPEIEVNPDDVKRFVKAVNNGRDMLNNMVGASSNIPRDTAIERIRGSLIGPNGRQTCVIVSVTPEATSHLKQVMGRGLKRPLKLYPDIPQGLIHRAVSRVGIEPDKVHFGGPPVDNIAIDEEGEKTLVRLAGLSGLLGLGLAYWSLRSVKLTLVVFACGVLSAASALALIWLTGETVDAVVLSMPALVYVLTISGAVHFINYYRDAVLDGGMYRATERAAIHAFKPAFLCSITTSLGLLSLYASDLTPIRKFGVYSAAGVFIMLAVTFFYLPAALQFWQFGRRWLNQSPESHKEEAVADERQYSMAERFWAVYAGFIVRNYVAVAIITICITAAIGWGVTKTRTSIDLLELFDSRARILRDYRWLEANIGCLVPMEIVVKFDKRAQSVGHRTSDSEAEELYRLTFLERLETVALIQETIEAKFGERGQQVVGKSLSAATFIPSLPSDTSNYVKRRTYDSRLSQSRDEFIKAGFLRIDPQDESELWRVSLRVAAFKGVDYGQFVGELSEEIEPITAAHDYRVQILRDLTKWNEQYTGSNVFIWDRPYSDPQLQQRHESMISALGSLLKKARIKFKRGEPSLDVPQVSLADFNNFDAVVLAGPFTKEETSSVRNMDYAIDKIIDLQVNSGHISSSSTLVAGSDSWMSAVYTGVVPIVYKAQRELLQSLIQSTIWSFLTITPLMMFVSRSVRAGAVAMIPNVMPILIVFGAMGWLNISIDIGSMMTSSIALGVAVDDTIHFLAWFRSDLDQLRDRKKAIVAAYRRCATPTLQAALISGLGLSVFAFSTFTPTQRFGWLMLTILVTGVISELVLLPSILASPLGKVFEPHTHRKGLRRWWLLAKYQLTKRTQGSVSPDHNQKAA